MDVNLPSERETLSGDVSAIGVTSSSGNVLSHLREIIPASHPSPPHRVRLYKFAQAQLMWVNCHSDR